MKRLTVIVEPGPCYLCPFCYDGGRCRAVLDDESEPHGTSTLTGREVSGAYSGRPDWCPLTAGGEVVMRAAS
jgi:hypothetical protein